MRCRALWLACCWIVSVAAVGCTPLFLFDGPACQTEEPVVGACGGPCERIVPSTSCTSIRTCASTQDVPSVRDPDDCVDYCAGERGVCEEQAAVNCVTYGEAIQPLGWIGLQCALLVDEFEFLQVVSGRCNDSGLVFLVEGDGLTFTTRYFDATTGRFVAEGFQTDVLDECTRTGGSFWPHSVKCDEREITHVYCGSGQ